MKQWNFDRKEHVTVSKALRKLLSFEAVLLPLTKGKSEQD